MKNFQNKKYFQYQPYYKGTLHTINNSSTVNNIYTNTSRNKIIRLNSANNSLVKIKIYPKINLNIKRRKITIHSITIF